MNLPALLAAIPPVVVYAVVAVTVMVESFGIPVPGETAVIAATLLAMHAHTLSPWLIIAAAAAGAIIGDSIGYEVGRHFGSRLVGWATRRFPKHLSADHVAYAEHVFDRHGVWAVFFGRFVALLRMLAGPLSGILGLRYPRFLVANASGAVLWVSAIVGAIMVFGTLAERWFSEASWAVLGVLVVAALLSGRLLHRELARRVRDFAEQRRARPRQI